MFEPESKPYVLVDFSEVQTFDYDRLRDCLDGMVAAQADGVVFSLFRPGYLTSMIHSPEEADTLRDQRIARGALKDLRVEYSETNFDVLATIYDPELLEWYAELPGRSAFLIDPGDITYKRFLLRAFELDLSAGVRIKASRYSTVERALGWLGGPKGTILLHEAYRDADESSLDGLDRFSQFDVPAIGFADPTGNPDLARKARRKGVSLWCPWLAPDMNGSGYSLQHLARLIEEIKKIQPESPGIRSSCGPWELTDQDHRFQQSNRRSLMADRSLSAGTTLTYDMIRELRPGVGLPADQIDNCVGTLIQRPTDPQEMITY